MKVTDYAPRAAPFDSHLKGRDLIGAEVGVDVGAHAEALLRYRGVAMLHLIDVWPNPYCRGYCEGRLAAQGFGPRFTMVIGSSLAAATNFKPETLDFVYIDQEHDAGAVCGDLTAWWPLLKRGGMLGYRNYMGRGAPLDIAVEEFIESRSGEVKVSLEDGEILLGKI
jgi:hypothetical protein